MGIVLDDDIKQVFPQGADLFQQMMSIEGEVYRALEGRRTQSVVLANQKYFIKQHFGIGWKEIFKNIFTCRQPTLSAYSEYRALQRLQQLGVSVPAVAGYGRCGFNPAKIQSFILTQALEQTISLEDFCKEWAFTSPSYFLKKAVIKEVARVAKCMHENKMNHRDFYMCHFLLDISQDIDEISPHAIRIFLIDLHRAQIRRMPKQRWFIKDLAGIYFSSKDFGLTLRDFLYFIKLYRGLPLRTILRTEKRFWQTVIKRGEHLYQKHKRRMARQQD